MVLAAVGVGGELLAPVLDPAHRAAAAQREPGEADFLGQQDALVAEAAADVGRDHPDLALVEAEAFGEAGADDVRHLRGGVHHQLPERGGPSAATTPRPSSGAMHCRAVRSRRA